MRKYTINDFNRNYPDEDTCLERLRKRHYPDGSACEKCLRETKYHRDAGRRSYSCQFCGHHVHPTAGTIFHKSTTPLRLWFHAIHLMAQTRCGISAKQLERTLGVTYKTAWRMFNKIRSMLRDGGDERLSGTVEADETYVGGKRKGDKRGRPGEDSHKTPVFGMAERKGDESKGRVAATVVRNTKRKTVMPHIKKKVLPESMVYTDEYAVYDTLGKEGYRHDRVNHSQEVYVSGDIHTNTIEGFWSLVKRGIAGVYHSVSAKHLQGYLNEYAFRYNHRKDEQPMFVSFLDRVGARVG
jgi:transposase-like protein